MDEQTLNLTDEYEDIDGNEVDAVVESLEVLSQDVESDSIRAILEDAADEIYQLFYEDDAKSKAA